MRQNIAYFVGGPEDLTKRVLKEVLPVLQFAEMPPMFAVDVVPGEAPPPDTAVTYRVHNYEKVGKFDDPTTNSAIFIYAHQGIR